MNRPPRRKQKQIAKSHKGRKEDASDKVIHNSIHSFMSPGRAVFKEKVMSSKKLEYTIHILEGVTIITSKVGLVTRNGPLIAAENGKSCFVDVRNLESGEGTGWSTFPEAESSTTVSSNKQSRG